ncbi:MAG: AAA family ATPase [Phycisphaerae bacterium]
MPSDSTTAKLVEKQMRNWEIARQQRPQVERDQGQKQVEDFVTISREVAAGGYAVAEQLGRRLGWPVFDKEILQYMAGDNQVRARLYEKMDERDTNWLESVLRWLLQGEFRKEDYFHRLSEAVLALARQGPAVFLGRCADLILPADRGLRVRLLAPEETRVREHARRNRCDEKTARAQIEHIEHERAEFCRRVFGPDRAACPTRFDLTLNLGRVSQNDAVELIVTTLRLRGAQPT